MIGENIQGVLIYPRKDFIIKATSETSGKKDGLNSFFNKPKLSNSDYLKKNLQIPINGMIFENSNENFILQRCTN